MALIKEYFVSPTRWIDHSAEFVPSRSLVNSEVFFGVELELENCKYELPEHGGTPVVGNIELPGGMLAHKDGSLRNGGIELITLPIRGAELVSQIKFMCKVAQEHKWKPSNRAGLHVHVDVQDLTIPRYMNLLKAYALIEPCFFNASGNERSGSIYCKSWFQHASNDVLRSVLEQMAQGIGDNMPSRYLGLNINSTRKHGTIEFRHKNSTVDPEEILDWVNVIGRWYNYAMSVNLTPDMVQSMTPDNAVMQVFGDTQLMDPTFPSQFYNGCVATWFDIFGPVAKSDLTWQRAAKQAVHKGYKAFIAKMPKQAPQAVSSGLNIQNMLGSYIGDFTPSVGEQVQAQVALPPVDEAQTGWVPSYFNAAMGRRIYFEKPEPRADKVISPLNVTRVLGPRTWERLWSRTDLYVTASTTSERSRGANDYVFLYGFN